MIIKVENNVIFRVPASSALNPHAEPFPAPPNDKIKEILQDLSDNRCLPIDSKDEERTTKRRRVKNLFPLSIALVSIAF